MAKAKSAYEKYRDENLSPREIRDFEDARFFCEIRQTLIKRFQQKGIVKTIYSYVLVFLTLFVIGGTGVVIWFLAKNPSENVVAFVTAIAGFVGTLLSLPTIMTKHFFSSEEDQLILEQVNKMRANDAETRMLEQTFKKDEKEISEKAKL